MSDTGPIAKAAWDLAVKTAEMLQLTEYDMCVVMSRESYRELHREVGIIPTGGREKIVLFGVEVVPNDDMRGRRAFALPREAYFDIRHAREMRTRRAAERAAYAVIEALR